MEFENYMKEHRADIPFQSKLWYELETAWYSAIGSIDTDGRTIAKEDFDLAVGHVVSFYQSKRAMLKKQVTHWIGKFMIVKHENNVLRKRVENLKASVLELIEENTNLVAHEGVILCGNILPEQYKDSEIKKELVGAEKS